MTCPRCICHRPSPAVRAILLATIAVLLSVMGAQARSIYFTLDGGITPQSGPASFRRMWNSGYGGGIGVLFAAESGIGLTGKVEYERFPMNTAADTFDLGAVQAWLVSLSTRYALLDEDDPYRPYFVLGGGTAYLSLTTASQDRPLTEYDSNDLRAYFQIGVGLEAALSSEFKVLAEVRFVSIQSKFGGQATSFFPMTVGMRF